MQHRLALKFDNVKELKLIFYNRKYWKKRPRGTL